ncbi:MAG: PDGLE domain-containing protein [Candidatus Omnitrophota bacterium]
MKTTQKLWLGILILVILSPLGLILPHYFKAGSAWGEWGSEEVGGLVGYIPKGLAKLSTIWNALIPDYAFKGWEEKGLGSLSLAYIASAIIGIFVIICVVLLIGKFLHKKD